MNKNSFICRFIDKHKDDWEEILSTEPYHLKIKRAEGEEYKNLCIFNYFQALSDFSIPEVKEARGIIINVKTLEVVCWPFRKFSNFGEPYADTIDWSTARVTEKIDGSIMKLWYNKPAEKWELSSNSIIDAYTSVASPISGCVARANPVFLGNLFDIAAKQLDKSALDKDKTYIFELCSPENTVVVEHSEPKIYHIGTRHNITGEESNDDIGIEKPKEYALNSLEACRAFADADGPDEYSKDVLKEPIKFEGLVVNDANYNRIKVKNWKYVAVHYYLTAISPHDVVEIILEGEADEFLTYFPQHKETFKFFTERFNKLTEHIQNVMDTAIAEYERLEHNRKAFASFWMSTQDKNDIVWGFNALDGKTLQDVLHYMHYTVNHLTPLLCDP